MEKVKKHLKVHWQSYFLNSFILLVICFFIWVFFFSDILKNFLLWLELFFQTQKEYAYLIAFFMAISEGTIILSLVPGTSYVVTAGVFWARGDMDPFILFPVVILGAFLGDILGYTMGHFSSGFVKKKIGNDSNYKIGENFIKKHGGKSVFFARFISGIKEMVPFIAGVLSMKIKMFMIWNFLGAIGWSILFLSLGYFLGDNIEEIDSVVKATGFGILIMFLIGIFLMYRKEYEKNNML